MPADTTLDPTLESSLPQDTVHTIDSKAQSWYLTLLGEVNAAASSEYGPTIEQIGSLSASLYQSRIENSSSRRSDADWQEESLFQELSGSQDIPWARFGILHIRM